MEHKEFINQIETGIFPREHWNHLAHLRFALYHLFTEQDFFKALSKIKSGIVAYNTASHVEGQPNAIYSETITVFWVTELFRLFDQHKDATLDELNRFLLASDLVRFDFIYGFYSKQLLESSLSKEIFIESDLSEK